MNGRRQLREQAEDLLAGLGSSRAEVAGSLIDLGVRGIPQDSAQCVIARYLAVVLGADRRVTYCEVGQSHLKIVSRNPRRLPLVLLVALPEAVCQFIAAFDDRMYPALVGAPVTRCSRGQEDAGYHQDAGSTAGSTSVP